MSKIEEAQDILRQLGLPERQQNELSALVLLALADLSESEDWSEASKQRGTVPRILNFIKDAYGKEYPENTRHIFRRRLLHHFLPARIVDRNPYAPHTVPLSQWTHYGLTDEVLELLRLYQKGGWDSGLQEFSRLQRFYAIPTAHVETANLVIRYTNEARTRYNLEPIVRYLPLDLSAQAHSNWMARPSLSHPGDQDSTPRLRLKFVGFAGQMAAANIYKFPASCDHKKLARDLVDGWMKSPGHRANILNGQLRYIGVGIAQSGSYAYVTQDFGG